MKKLLLLAALSMVATFALASVALADTTMSVSPSASSSSSASAPCSETTLYCTVTYDSASAPHTNSGSPSASALLTSGGLSPRVLIIVPALLLIGSGLLSASIIRRS